MKEIDESNKKQLYFESKDKINAAVLVLGDLNRSPRMLNHATAIASLHNIKQVSLIGFNGGDLRSDVANDEKIKPYYLPFSKLNKFFSKLPRLLFPLTALVKIFFQLVLLLYRLFTIPNPTFIILQNPPSIPSLIICIFVCFIRRGKLVLDWHNYGYTILKINKRNFIMINIAFYYEKWLSKFANHHLCVSTAMQNDLFANFKIKATALPDKPLPKIFKRIDDRTDSLFISLCFDVFSKYKEVFNVNDFIVSDENNKKMMKGNRPFVLLSSTSWTPDEDFDLLLNAASLIDLKLKAKVLCVITGRGDMRDLFFEKVKKKGLKNFEFKSIWVESDDYPKLLGCADLGVCLHYSSSGLDLPMKVVDMFAAGLPVLAHDYKTITELVTPNKYGELFKTAEELGLRIETHVNEFYKGDHKLNLTYRSNIAKDFNEDWMSQWERVMIPVLSLKNKNN